MWKALIFILFLTPVYAQVFTQDISKIAHHISENQLENFTQKPTAEGLPADYLKSMVSYKYLDPLTNCPDEESLYRPEKVRYEVLMISEDVPKAKTTVVVAKYKIHEEDHVIVQTAKKILESQASHPGKFKANFSQGAGKKIIHYVNPNTSVKLNSEVRGENAYSVDVEKMKSAPAPIDTTLKVDIVNRLDITQVISSDTEIKGSLEALHTTGTRDLKALDGVTFHLDKVKANARLDQKLSSNVKSFTEVKYSGNNFEQDVSVTAGLDIQAPNNAEILVFTGYTSRQQGLKTRSLASNQEEAEIGIKYKTKSGVKFFGRVREGDEKSGTTYETGLEVDFGK